jgi:hypothetical protein
MKASGGHFDPTRVLHLGSPKKGTPPWIALIFHSHNMSMVHHQVLIQFYKQKTVKLCCIGSYQAKARIVLA